MPRRDPWVYIGLVAFFALLFVALFGERIAPHEPIYFVVEHGRDPRPYDPGVVFPFGSDVLGRDLFSVVLAGARTTLLIVLLGGTARVTAGLIVAALAMWWRPVRLVVEGAGELVAAVPATLIALGLVKVFVRSDTSILVFVGALLVTGWAGPYRLVRVELERLAHLPFTEGAVTLGVRRFGIFRRHYLPHLVPILAVNLSQQVIASLVLLAELGVLGVAVGAVRLINVEESLAVVRLGPGNRANISDPVEWGGLLANARSIESLWTTRWLFLAPGIAFALTAVAVAAIGFGIARHYARRNILHDLRGRSAAGLALVTVAFFAASALLPERYAAAEEWAVEARAGVRDGADVEMAFRAAGARPLGDSYALERDTTSVVKTGTTSVRIGIVTVNDETSPPTELRTLAYSETGGGSVDASLVFVGRGVSPADYPPIQTSIFSAPDLGTTIKGFADDYAAVDIRGKVVVLTRFVGVDTGSRRTLGPDVQSMIENALKRKPAAVLFVDPLLPRYVQVSTSFATPVDPYTRLEAALPIAEPRGIPVVVMSPPAANRLLAPLGIDIVPFVDFLDSNDAKVSPARELSVRATVGVTLERVTAHIRTLAAETTSAASDRAPVMVWAVRRAGAAHPTADVIASVAALMAARGQPFVFVDFDASVDANANARDVFDRLAGKRIALIVVLDGLDGSALSFATIYGDLIPAMDRYAEKAGAAHLITRVTTLINDWTWPGIRSFIDMKAVLVRGNGGAGDLRGDAAAFVGYLGGRAALGDEALPR